MSKNTICLWYDKDAEEAARFYADTFPDSKIGAVIRAPGKYPDGEEETCWSWSSRWQVSRASD